MPTDSIDVTPGVLVIIGIFIGILVVTLACELVFKQLIHHSKKRTD